MYRRLASDQYNPHPGGGGGTAEETVRQRRRKRPPPSTQQGEPEEKKWHNKAYRKNPSQACKRR